MSDELLIAAVFIVGETFKQPSTMKIICRRNVAIWFSRNEIGYRKAKLFEWCSHICVVMFSLSFVFFVQLLLSFGAVWNFGEQRQQSVLHTDDCLGRIRVNATRRLRRTEIISSTLMWVNWTVYSWIGRANVLVLILVVFARLSPLDRSLRWYFERFNFALLFW